MTVLSRLAALVVAIGLVVAAVVWRDGRTGDDQPRADEAVVAGCVESLESVCRLLGGDGGVDWEVAGASAHAAALQDDGSAAVLLPAAWADLVDDARRRSGREPLARSDVLATSPLLLVAFEDRARVLAAACDLPVERLDWACVGEHAGSRWADLGGDVRWGDVVVGHAGADSAVGLQATAAVVAARTGLPFSLADLRDTGFRSWFGRVERSVVDFDPPGGSHLTAMVTRGPSIANVATATEAEASTRDLDTAFGRIVVSAPEPLFEVALVVAGIDEDRVRDLARRLDPAALADSGWRTGSGVPAGAALPDLPPLDETPDGGVLSAVRDTWRETAG